MGGFRNQNVPVDVDAIKKAYIGWFEDDIKRGPGVREGLGKFFFGVSTGTIGLIVTLTKLTNSPPTFLFWVCLLILTISALVGLAIAIPAIIFASKQEDQENIANLNLSKLHFEQMQWFKTLIVAWLVPWVFGAILSVVFISITPPSDIDENSVLIKKLTTALGKHSEDLCAAIRPR